MSAGRNDAPRGPLGKLYARLLLSLAKHPSLLGHARMARRAAKLVPFYEYDEREIFSTDDAPEHVARQRREGFDRLARELRERAPKTLAASAELAEDFSDVAFVNSHRVPFQFSRFVRERIGVGCVVAATDGARVRDLDGNWSIDVGGSYGVNLFGYEFYKRAIDRGAARARELGPVLGSYHPLVADNVRRLREVSGLDEVSFHMSGTEAVMQAARLARYHTGRSHLVRFCGSYHGWWDGVQAGVGNPRPAHEVYTLKEMDPSTLRALRARNDVACVLVNPIQAMHPNGAPPNDGTLLASDRKASYDKARYAAWLRELRELCTERGIVLIFDEVFLGFRLARGGAQEYFGVKADLVTYGKTLGGGLPIGAVCGRRDLMRRYRDDQPADICFARGTFHSHPYVMATMNEFLRYLDEPEARATYEDLDARWDARARRFNDALASRGLPVRVANMASVWTTLFTQPGRYNWLLQYYLRAAGLSPSWIGTARIIFSHDLRDEDVAEIERRFVAACVRMREDGFFWADAALTNKAIKRRVMGELLRARFGRGASGRATRA